MRSLSALALATCLLTSACVFVKADTDDGDSHAHADGRPSAKAKIMGRSGVDMSGSATFHEVEGGVLVRIMVENTPPGWHAVHVHEIGDCSSADGKSAGGHFNPGGVMHGSPHAAEHHAGDLGNMWVDESGKGNHAILMPELTIVGDDFSVVGRGIIVHAGADDLVTQPTGAAGGRIGCGVIE